MLRIDPSVSLPGPTQYGPVDPEELLETHKRAKYRAVGYRTNHDYDYHDWRKGIQDNSYVWPLYGQIDFNKKNYIPDLTADLRDRGLVVASVVDGIQVGYTIGELAAIYGDYRRTVHCKNGDCFLTNANTTTLRFDQGEDCFPWPTDCGWEPTPMEMWRYLKYIGNGLNPPYGTVGNQTPDIGRLATGNTAADDEYSEAGWWGDEMLRLASTNDWHFSDAAIAWYVGMHRLALLYVDLARRDNRYWNDALHYEANALHSLTDRFAFGHMVTNRDRTSYEIVKKDDLQNRQPYRWAENVLRLGGATRSASGQVLLAPSLPRIADVPTPRNDFLPTYAGDIRPKDNWTYYALQEMDFHNAFNANGAMVRNLKGDDAFFIVGDKGYQTTSFQTKEIIAEAVRASLQSIFDAYVALESGESADEIGAPGSPYFVALKSIPIFVEFNQVGPYKDHFDFDGTIGNNFNGQWVRSAQAIEEFAGTNVVPNESPLPCVMQYVDGALNFSELNTRVQPCMEFPIVAVTPSATLNLAQNYPNPFNPSTAIRFELPQTGFTQIQIFGLDGARVATILAEVRKAGANLAKWDGMTDSGAPAASGVYFYRLEFQNKSISKKLTLIR